MQIRYLHLSDLHFKGDKKKSAAEIFNQGIVTTEMLSFIKTLLEGGNKIDFIVITGDLAFEGKREDYLVAKVFCNNLLKALELKNDNLFLIPGNHDVNREEVKSSHINRLYNFGTEVEITELMLDLDLFPTIMRKFSNYNLFANEIMGWEAYNDSTYCYRKSLFLQKNGKKIEINLMGLNSALFAGYDGDDKQKLALGMVQIKKMLSEICSNAVFSMAFFHHPFECFNPAEETVKNLLMKQADIILTGHLHKSSNMFIENQAGKAFIVGAEAFFKTRESKNSFNIVNIDVETGNGSIQFYKYLAAHNSWKMDTDINPESTDGKLSFYIGKTSGRVIETRGQIPLIIPETYSRWITNKYGHVDLENLQGTNSFVVKLPEIFIPLYANVSTKSHESGIEKSVIVESDIECLIAKHDALVVEGEAGSGKTTLFQHVAYQLATGKPVFEMDNYLPILIFLKEWNDFFCNLDLEHNPMDNILKHYSSLCKNCIDLETLKRFYNVNRIVFLLDGLDEIPKENRELIIDFFADYGISTENKVMFSGRNHGVNGKARERFSEGCVKVKTLNSEQVSEFVTKWFRYIYLDSDAVSEDYAKGMLDHIKVNSDVNRLIDNPLMLTAASILYHDGKVLPDQRAQLYEKFVDNLIRRRFKFPESVLRFLGDLAFDMHKEMVKAISLDSAVKILMDIYKDRGQMDDWEYNKYIEELFHEIESKCGLMEFKAGQYAFRHLTYQEFLTAVNIKHRFSQVRQPS